MNIVILIKFRNYWYWKVIYFIFQQCDLLLCLYFHTTKLLSDNNDLITVDYN